jgi:hypothetical protein
MRATRRLGSFFANKLAMLDPTTPPPTIVTSKNEESGTDEEK